MKKIFFALARLFENRGALRSLLIWPKFSITSYNMLCALRNQAVLPGSVIDVGANVGQFAVAAAKIFPDARVYSFEPNPDCLVQLRKNTAGLGNVSVHPLALGEQTGEVAFHLNSYSLSSSILPLANSHRAAFPYAQEIGTIKVKMDTLNHFFDEVLLPRPALLKLDIQGYEAQALRGAGVLLKQIDYVVLEASFKPMYQGECLFMEITELMKGMGFVFVRPLAWASDPKSGEIVQMDALFQRD